MTERNKRVRIVKEGISEVKDMKLEEQESKDCEGGDE